MQVKTSELTGHSLMWAVNQCEFTRLVQSGEYVKSWVLKHHREGYTSDLCPLTALEIIEREHISVLCAEGEYNPDNAGTPDCYDTYWVADIGRQTAETVYGPQSDDWGSHFQISEDCITGDTFIEAAMRCYVLKNLGETVDMPDTIKPTQD